MTTNEHTPVARPYLLRVAYTLFTIGGLILSLRGWPQHLGDGLAMFGIALAFDPFDTAQPFGQRPRWQRAWLLVHVAGVLVMLVAAFLR
ncbi:MAG: hypothetical protein MUF62_08510 [Chitinophagaceae bacterium]|nr:hypothetical protein [Chitinophagaceae bacterium]